MIRLGFDDAEKERVVRAYCEEHGITKVFVLSPERFAPSFARCRVTTPEQLNGELGVYLGWPDHIEYRFYYHIIQSLDDKTLIVLNEIMRGQDRFCLNYNCVRTFLASAKHQIVFQHFPVIDTMDDFMILVDMDTRSRWRSEGFRPSMMESLDVMVRPWTIELEPLGVNIDEKTRVAYEREKATQVHSVREDVDKDPHNIPRNLALVTGKSKLPLVLPSSLYVGRNNRFKLSNATTYREAEREGERIAFELPHNFIDMTDFLAVSRQRRMQALVANTKADEWYFQRFLNWAERLKNATCELHG